MVVLAEVANNGIRRRTPLSELQMCP
jgi:hypothetical protein